MKIEITGGKKNSKASKPAKAKKTNSPFTCSVSMGGAGGQRYLVSAPGKEPIPGTKFIRLLGYAGYSRDMAAAVLRDAMIAGGTLAKDAEPKMGMINTQTGDGRAQFYGRKTFHGGVEASTVEQFGKLVQQAKDYYLELCGEKGTIDTDEIKAKKPAKAK